MTDVANNTAWALREHAKTCDPEGESAQLMREAADKIEHQAAELDGYKAAVAVKHLMQQRPPIDAEEPTMIKRAPPTDYIFELLAMRPGSFRQTAFTLARLKRKWRRRPPPTMDLPPACSA